jgi:hypothetical protein
MRRALFSLIAAGAVAAVSIPAVAQEATPAVPPVPTPAPASPETPSAATASPSEAVVPAVQAPPPAPVVEAPPAPPPAPAVPTDPTTLQVLNVMESVCKPLVQGGDLAALTKPLRFKKKRDVYTLALAKPAAITVRPPGSNDNVCMLEITHAVRGDQPMTVALHDWAIARGYTLYRNDEFTTDLKRHTRSWELTADGKTEALVLVTTRKPDGSPMVRNADTSTLMYSVR